MIQRIAAAAALAVLASSASASIDPGTIPVRPKPGARLFVANPAGDTLSILDPASHAVLSAPAAGDSPARVAVAAKGGRAYVSDTLGDSIAVIDLATNAMIGAPIPVGDAPGVVALSPDGKRLYVGIDGAVQVVDVAARAVVATIAVGGLPGSIALTADGARAYVAAGPLSIVDTATNAVVATLAIGTYATHVALSLDGDEAWISTTNFNFSPQGFSASGAMTVLDTATNAPVATLYTGSLPGPLAFSPDGSQVHVALTATWVNTGYGAGFLPARHVMAIDAASRSIVAYTDVGKTAAGIAVRADGAEVFASVPGTGSVSVIATATHAVTATLGFSGGVGGLAIGP